MARTNDLYQWRSTDPDQTSCSPYWERAWWLNLPHPRHSDGYTKGFIITRPPADGYWISWTTATGPFQGPYPTLEAAKAVYLLEGGGVP